MDDEDGKYLAETLRVLQQADAWAARTSADAPGLRPAPGSPLCGDDNRAHPYELSHAAWHFLSGAVDHLGCLYVLLDEAKVIHMYAPFTLVRAALENACGAVWLLEPRQRKERLSRRLLLAIDDVRQREHARQLVGQPGPRTMQTCLDEIREIAKRANLYDAALKGKATYTQMVQTVDQIGPGKQVEVSWKVCSAFAHGDMWATLGASQQNRMASPAQHGIATLRIEANLKLLMSVTAAAVAVTRLGWHLYEQRCQPPYWPRP